MEAQAEPKDVIEHGAEQSSRGDEQPASIVGSMLSQEMKETSCPRKEQRIIRGASCLLDLPASFIFTSSINSFLDRAKKLPLPWPSNLLYSLSSLPQRGETIRPRNSGSLSQQLGKAIPMLMPNNSSLLT